MSSAAPKSMPTPEEILETALKLPEEQRLRLAEQIRQSVHDAAQNDVETAWGDEIADRVEALRRGEVETVLASEVFDRVRSKRTR